ncbi:Protein of unknown function [Amycolatopsis marina]|uniref:DUF4237 domain-containing protein n=1 Tax=Amycolatopsis marina TaxID=490629 RepID=A0A1I1A9P4_9PSEU|nr:TNT domain-containing protein [Amycolatopsis marina]SFB34252.1 Protein of unknown function [Amycolatopsis marina]
MGIELPAELSGIAVATGLTWPEADEDVLRAHAVAWRDAQELLSVLAADADTAAADGFAALGATAADAARSAWSGLSDADEGVLGNAAREAGQAAERLERAAEQIAEAKVELVRQLVRAAENTEAARVAAGAGHPAALLGVDITIRSAAAGLAAVTEGLAEVVGTSGGAVPVEAGPADPLAGPRGEHGQAGLISAVTGVPVELVAAVAVGSGEYEYTDREHVSAAGTQVSADGAQVSMDGDTGPIPIVHRGGFADAPTPRSGVTTAAGFVGGPGAPGGAPPMPYGPPPAPGGFGGYPAAGAPGGYAGYGGHVGGGGYGGQGAGQWGAQPQRGAPAPQTPQPPPAPRAPRSAQPQQAPPPIPLSYGAPRQERESIVALFLVHMFPIGHLPVASARPARQLPSPPEELDYAAGLRFAPHDHPRSGLIDPAHALDSLRAGERRPAAPPVEVLPSPPTRLTEDHDPLAGMSERDWEHRYLVRTASGRVEYVWPPGESYPEGGQAEGEPVLLAVGTPLDRFGTAAGRVFAPEGTPFARRSLPPAHLEAGYRRYRVLRELPAWRAMSAGWFGQPGGGVRIRTIYSAAELVTLGYLADVTFEAES